MARKNSVCEPFRAWNRLEPRTRKREFDQAVRAEIHDPLWMLSRQWQFGEFKGEDTGSVVFAKIQIEHRQMKQFLTGTDLLSSVEFKSDNPLEKTVESIGLRFSFKERVNAGQYFLKLAQKNLNNLPSDFVEKIASAYPIKSISFDVSDTDDLRIQKAKLISDRSLMQFLDVFSDKSPDGLELYKAIKSNELEKLSDIPFDSLTQLKEEYIEWFEKCFNIINEDTSSPWNHQSLEYQFACSFAEQNNVDTILVADEFYSGHLDWFSFDIEEKKNTSSASTDAPSHNDDVATEVFSFIPTEVSFRGMPNNRWWTFEDGKVDLGNISAETTDIAKLMVAEFALIYSNDWFLVPYTLPVGSLSEIKGFMVTDVFGQRTLIKATTQGEKDDWSSWGFFNLSTKTRDTQHEEKCNTRLFLPPTITKVQESEAIEEVTMLRDEMANMVWAIETKVNGLLNSGIDGHTLANERKVLLQGEDKPPLEADETAVLKYTLSNEVPQNWIPLIPVHVKGENRAMQLQRASMPFEMNKKHFPVRPRTDILRFGFSNNTENESSPYIDKDIDKQIESYFIHEEEVSKTGINIASMYKRARWYNGKIVEWSGYKKSFGSGEGNSGLRFDQMKMLK